MINRYKDGKIITDPNYRPPATGMGGKPSCNCPEANGGQHIESCAYTGPLAPPGPGVEAILVPHYQKSGCVKITEFPGQEYERITIGNAVRWGAQVGAHLQSATPVSQTAFTMVHAAPDNLARYLAPGMVFEHSAGDNAADWIVSMTIAGEDEDGRPFTDTPINLTLPKKSTSRWVWLPFRYINNRPYLHTLGMQQVSYTDGGRLVPLASPTTVTITTSSTLPAGHDLSSYPLTPRVTDYNEVFANLLEFSALHNIRSLIQVGGARI